MLSSPSTMLLLAAALVLAVAPLLALFEGTVEPLSWLTVLLVAVCAWGAARGAEWVKWLALGLALWEVREVWIGWRYGPQLRGLVPHYVAWHAAHVAAAVLLAGAVVTLWVRRRDTSGAD